MTRPHDPRRAAELLTGLLDASEEPTALVAPDGTVLELNTAFARSCGLSPRELRGERLRSNGDPALAAAAIGCLERLRTGEADAAAVERIITGEQIEGRWIAPEVARLVLRAAPTTEALNDGQPGDAAFAEHEEILLRRFPGILFVGDLEFQVQTLRGSVRELTGYDAAELLRGEPTWNRLVHPDDHKRVVRDDAAAIRAESRPAVDREYRIVAKDGSVRWVREIVRTFGDGHEAPRRVHGVILDVSDRRRAEQELRASQEMYRALVENVNDMVFLLDDQGQVRFANSYVGSHFDLPPESLKGVLLCFFWCGESIEAVDAAVAQVRRSRTEVSLEARCDVRLYQLKITPVFSGEEITDLICIARDLTKRDAAERERASLERQLLHTQKMDALGRLAGGVAHDFANLLSIIWGNAQLLVEDLGPDQELSEELSDILDASSRARELTRRLLTFARQDSPNPQPADVTAVAKEVVAMLRRTTPGKVALHLRVHASPLVCTIDVGQIHQALLNLCKNAIDAMPNGGTVQVECRRVDVDGESAQVGEGLEPGTYGCIEVRDTGAGIPPEVQARVFDPFFTTKPIGEGTGLGLSTTLSIAKRHDGHLALTSRPDQGTTVRLLLPCTEDETATVAATKTIAVQTGALLLIVDDAEQALRAFGKMAERAGHRVLLADRGDRAVELFRRHHQSVDLVILDMMMPDMDGWDVCQALRQLDPDVRVLLSSGYTDGRQLELFRTAGVTGFLPKPFTVAEFSQAVHEALQSRSSRRTSVLPRPLE